MSTVLYFPGHRTHFFAENSPLTPSAQVVRVYDFGIVGDYTTRTRVRYMYTYVYTVHILRFFLIFYSLFFAQHMVETLLKGMS